MNPDELEEALDLAMEGVRSMELVSILTPIELGLYDEDRFAEVDASILLSLLEQAFDLHIPVIDPGSQTIFLADNAGVSLYVSRSNAGDIVYFLAPESYEP